MHHFKKLISPYLFVLFLFTLLPMLLIVIYAITISKNEVLTFTITFENFQRFFRDSIFISVLLQSFKLGLITTVICLFIGYPVAYAISLLKEKTQTYLILLITIPTWINLLIRTYSWVSILSSKGILNNFLAKFGIGPLNLLYTDFAVIIGMIYSCLPFMILPIHSSLTKMDQSLHEASMDLGANPMITFLKITFPLSLPGVLTGITMVFLPAISTFVIPKILGGAQYTLIGSFIETQFITIGNWNFGSAVSLILAAFILILMSLMNAADRYTNSGDRDDDETRRLKRYAKK